MDRAPDKDPAKAGQKADVPGAQALVRGLDVLMAVGGAGSPLRFKELQEALGVPKASLHRLLAALQSRQLVRLDSRTKEYSLGSKVLDLARRTLDQSPIIRSCKPELSRLARKLRRAVCLYIPDGDEVFVLDFEDPDASQSRVVRVWPRLKVESSAAGLAILSRMDAEERLSLHALSGSSFDTALSLTQALGYTVLKNDENLYSIAAAVTDGAGYPIAAICCFYGEGNDKPEDLHEIGRLIADSAARASGNIGLSSSPSWILPKPAISDKQVRVLSDIGRDFMGENPVWSAVDHTLYWLDILAPALRWVNPVTSETGRVELPDLFGGLVLGNDGRILLAGRGGLFRLNRETHDLSLLIDPEGSKPDNRFNTASVDRDGALWAGTMSVDNSGGLGSLYRINADLGVEEKLARVYSPKNVAWSPDGSEIYFTEGKTSTLYAYSDSSLAPASRRVLVQASPELGSPNGITVDTQGGIWVAMFGGWSIRRYWPDGTLDRVINLPIPMPTNLAFGGDDLSTLYVTSTYIRVPSGCLTEAPDSGVLLEIKTDVKGLPGRYFGSGHTIENAPAAG